MAKKAPGRKRSKKRSTPSRYADEPPTRTLRLTFRYVDDRVELVRARRLRMVPPPSDRLGRLEPSSGFCCELRTERGRVAYRRFGANPIQTSVEAPSGERGKPFERRAVDEPSGEFDLLVPFMDEAWKIALLSDAHLRRPGAMETVAEFDLRDLPKEGRS